MAAQQLGQGDVALAEWETALQIEPLTLLMRAELADLPSLENGVPGDEPTDQPGVVAELVARGIIEIADGSG